jgi:hypothetical protein
VRLAAIGRHVESSDPTSSVSSGSVAEAIGMLSPGWDLPLGGNLEAQEFRRFLGLHLILFILAAALPVIGFQNAKRLKRPQEK